ncbi:MAG: leucine--tRNA ligase [Bacteroidetes bacterium]|jgi:leucyl-tRNA synthetase|nr:leucine--tRNA ligase [Bacteroidota bacterium]MCL5033804.1 leucine--tRNA ligase [Bacteroidota bacterium]
MKYDFTSIEQKWQKIWDQKKVYSVDLNDTGKKLYCLVMFLYPSGDKLHIGHWYNFAPTDTWARFHRLKGYNVFEPIGYDAFGLPAENYAIKTGVHPQDSTRKNITDIRSQLKKMGAMYDFDYEVDTSDPEYYKWTQWIFLELYKKGLAYRTNAPVNWCPKDQTVLANEQVVDGLCERCSTPVVRKAMTQWFFKITAYADKLLEGLDSIDWPERTKLMQRNWIGRSEGVEIVFKVENVEDTIKVFTTRPDTLFGATYVVLAPEHPLVQKVTKPAFKAAVDEYVELVAHENEIERTSTSKEKTGVPTGAFAINPINGEKIPIWIADYVLSTYGTGAVMAVPAHDERDFEFAQKYKLPIRIVVNPTDGNLVEPLKAAYVEEGVAVNSGHFNGLESPKVWDGIADELQKNGDATRKVNYRIRDWLLSRQRYWGAPIPIVHCDSCGEVPVPDKDLPVLLPYDVEFKPTGESPLARNDAFVNVACPKCGKPAKRDVDTMDTFVDSSWYFLRYLTPHLGTAAFDDKLVSRWLPVDKYVGGAEHAVMHLLYARFVIKALHDAGWVNFDEPFTSLVHQGIITNQGAKMSKSRGNVVNPDQFVNGYGADTFRMFLMFMGPYNEGGDWSDRGITGIFRFLNKIYDLYSSEEVPPIAGEKTPPSPSDAERTAYRKINQLIKKVTEDLEQFRFNTAIAALMEFVNDFTQLSSENEIGPGLRSLVLNRFNVLLAPFAPHLSEELHELRGGEVPVFSSSRWPEYDASAITEENVTLVVQVNGKVRAKLTVPIDSTDEAVKSLASTEPNVQRHLEGKTILKTIVVQNRLLNFVIK